MKAMFNNRLKSISVPRIRDVFYYGLLLFATLFALRLAEQRFIAIDRSYEILGGTIALVFLIVGFWAAGKWHTKHKSVDENDTNKAFAFSAATSGLESEMDTLLISQREKEILELIALGLSNQEIADRLFISLSTVKTHNQNLFVKLEVKRRTQAVEKAKRLNIIS